MPVEKGHYSLLLAICVSLFCTPLMLAGVNAVLPEMGASLHVGARELSLVGTSYSLGLAVFQLACGSFGDIAGHRRIFLWGALIFGGSGALLGFLQSIHLFLPLRFLQGVGGAMLSASGLALMASCAAPENRATYLGISGAAVYSGIACGPPLAGLITGLLSWRWIFWWSALASLGLYLLTLKTVSHDWRPARQKSFDWPGCGLYALAMAALTLASSLLSQSPVAGALLLLAFALLLAFFCLHEFHCPYPMFNMRLILHNRVLAFSSLGAFVNYASFFGIIFYFSFYLQIAKGKSVQETGFILAFQAVMQAISTPLAARLCQRWGAGKTNALGAGLCGVGLLSAAFLLPETPLAVLFTTQGFLGCGMSLFALANTNIILDSAGLENVGQASGLTGAVRTAGQLCSMVMITLSLGFFLGNQAVSASTMPFFFQSMRSSLLVFGTLNICAIGMSLARNRIKQE